MYAMDEEISKAQICKVRVPKLVYPLKNIYLYLNGCMGRDGGKDGHQKTCVWKYVLDYAWKIC